MQKNRRVFNQLLAALTRVFTEAVLNNIGPHPALRLLLDAFSAARYITFCLIAFSAVQIW